VTRVARLQARKQRRAGVYAYRHCGNRFAYRRGYDQFFLQQAADRVVQRDKRAGDARGTRAAVGLQHITIEMY